jgi:hypothetical protein
MLGWGLLAQDQQSVYSPDALFAPVLQVWLVDFVLAIQPR